MSQAVTRCCSVAVALTLVALASTACTRGPTQSHVSSAVVRHFKGLPRGGQGGDPRFRDEQPWVAWDGPRSIYVMTWGSGSCPRIPTSVSADDARDVVIRTVEHDFHEGDNACTDDLGVTTSVVRLPATVDNTQGLLVQIDGTPTRLAAR
jgi:hypothetical protein